MKQIIKLSYLMVFIMGGTPLGDLVQIACEREAEDLNVTWVSEELHNIRPTEEDIENIHQYLETLKKITTQISHQENEYRFLHLQALDHLQSYCADLIPDKNKEEILFLQQLLEIMKSNSSNKTSEIICLFIYSPGAHFFANKNTGVVIERLLIEGMLSQDDLRIMSSFVMSNIDEFNRSLKTFISYEQPYQKHRESIENFWDGLCDYLNASEFKKFTQNALACLDLGMPIPEIPADISKGENNHESSYDFVELLETKAQDNPALRPLLSAWINLIPVDDKYQKAALEDILESIRHIQEMKSAFLNSLLFSLQNGISCSKEVQDSLNSIRTDLSRFLSEKSYKEQFKELVQNILAMPLCAERRAAINHLLVAMHQNPL